MRIGRPHMRIPPSRSFAALIAVACVAALLVGCGPDAQRDDAGFDLYEPDTSIEPPDDTSSPPDDTRPSEDTSPPPPKKVTGAACDGADECTGSVCMPEENFPNGYCTELECEVGACAGADAVCVEFREGANGCLAGCEDDDDCRNGYSCQLAGGGDVTACLPGEPDPPRDFETTRQVLDVDCEPKEVGVVSGQTKYAFDFGITDDTDAFLMVPFVTEGSVRPVALSTPAGEVDLRNDYRHQNVRLSESFGSESLTGVGTFGEVALGWPIQVPYAPRYTDYLRPGGQYGVEVLADRTTPCLYVLENRAGTQLDLNFYFVGANGIDAGSAPSDRNLAAAVEELERIYEKIGVEIGEVRYRDVPDEIVAKYRRVTSREDAHRLTAYGEPPDDSLEGHLSVDVFLVDSVDLERAGSGDVLGLSAGIPGAPGLHGNARNGLVFQTTDLGSANEHVGLIMAHEIGHYLGLRHTTELYYGTDQGDQIDDLIGVTDPIDDTPTCEDIYRKVQRNPTDCADHGNLMFPVAPRPRENIDPRLSDGQAKAMTWNPLID